MENNVVINIELIGDRVLVKREDAEEKTAAGIIIPERAKELPAIGTVLAIGSLADRPLTVKVGDKVYFSKYAGTDIKLSGKDYLIVRDTDVIGKIPVVPVEATTVAEEMKTPDTAAADAYLENLAKDANATK